jgi:N12 class adenine-specific DNA methylase
VPTAPSEQADQSHHASTLGPVGLARRNLHALEVLDQLAQASTAPGEEDRAALAAWAGWGPMAKAFESGAREPWKQIGERVRWLLPPDRVDAGHQATPNSFYTSPAVVAAAWQALRGLGFAGGRALEPGCGNGVFMALTPSDLPVRWTGVERDPTSARIAELLHPEAEILTAPLERTGLRSCWFDAAVGNVPFGAEGPYDPTAPARLSLHNYFLWRALQAVRPGGLVVMVTSRYTLDAEGVTGRDALAADADLVGAVRLPTGAFSAHGTEVVADLIVLRRRHSSDSHRPDRSWLATRTPPELRTPINIYFLDHPEQVLGRMEPRAAVRAGHTLTVAFDGDAQALQAALATAVDRIVHARDQQQLRWMPPSAAATSPEEVALADADGRKEESFHLVDGVVHQVREGRLTPLPRANEELKALIGLRDGLLELLDAESDLDAPEATLRPLRVGLRGRYEAYTRRWGPINRGRVVAGPVDQDTGERLLVKRRPQLGGFRHDPDYPAVLALEDFDDETGEVVALAPILDRRVNRRPLRPLRADTPEEAIALCLDELGRFDLARTATLLGLPVLAAPAALGDRIFHDPELGRWVTAEEYLSGDVRHKLTAARAAADRDPDRWARNVAALEPVIPADLGPDEIKVKLGAPWIPVADVRAFLAETLCGTAAGERPPTELLLEHEPVTATWQVQAPRELADRPLATSRWGTARVNGFRLAELALNLAPPLVYDLVEDEHGTTRRVRNASETMLARERQRELDARFGKWLWEDPERTDRLVSFYNRRFNATVPRRFDGSYLTFPGLVDGFEPYPWQRDIVARILATPATLCGAAWGAGKTAAMYMAAIKLGQLGLVHKPMLVVPNHLLEQVTRDGKRLFPTARILMVTKDDLSRDRRKLFAARCAVQDWDVIVITHSAFTRLPMRPEVEADWLREEIARFQQAAMDQAATVAQATPHTAGQRQRPTRSRTAKQVAKMVLRMEARLAELLDRPVDDGVTFEALGVDWIAVDESQAFKNRGVAARAEGFSMASSKRATDLAMRTWWLRRRNPTGRWGALFSGTPVSNSMLELYVLQLLLQEQRLRDLGLDAPDAWAGMFVRFETRVEVAPDGSGFRSHYRPWKFINLPELGLLLAEVADFRSRRRLNLPGPQLQRDTVVAMPSKTQLDYISRLVERADAIHAGGVDPHDDNMLNVTSDGRRIALCPSLVGLPGTSEKVAALVAKIAGTWRRTADRSYPDARGEISPVRGALQIVFCDQGTPHPRDPQVYGKLRAGLTTAGVPADKIRFVHDAKTDAARAQLFADCRAGRVAVLVGSTEKLGTGVNIQRRCIAIHHADPPWKSTEIQQRTGRGDRPGNHNDTLEVVFYVTQQSFDAYMFETLQRKAAFIAQLLDGDWTEREAEDIGDATLTYAQIKALATGNPLMLELAEVDAELVRLRTLEVGHIRDQRRARSAFDAHTATAEAAERRARSYEAIAAAAEGTTPVFVTNDGRQLTDRPAIGHVLAEAAQAALERDADPQTQRRGTRRHRERPGRWCGLDVEVEATRVWRQTEVTVRVRVARLLSASVQTPEDWLEADQQWRLARRLATLVQEAAATAARKRAIATDALARAAEFEPELQRPFTYAEELAATERRHDELEATIRAQADGVEEAEAAA